MLRVALFAVAVLLALPAGAFAASPPAGATAQCRDGSYSFSRSRSGTCSHHGGVAAWLTPGTPSTAPSAGTPALGRTVLLSPRTRASNCKRGPSPDRACSPGAYLSGLTASVLCSPGFHTSTIRNVPESLKHAVEIEYGMPARAYGRTIEIDHIVPLELGGSNDIANLFPEPGSGVANYRIKDRLENRLHAMVCAGQIVLRAAQQRIAADWQGLYRQVYGVAPVE